MSVGCKNCGSDDVELDDFWWNNTIQWQEGEYHCKICLHRWNAPLLELIDENQQME